MNEAALEKLAKMSDGGKNESMKFSRYKALREQAAQKALLHQARLHDENTDDYNNLELELHRAFMFGLKVIEHSNSYYLKFNESTKGYIKKFATPIDSAMALNENVEYSWEVQYILSKLEPFGKKVKVIEFENLHSARMKYMDSIKTDEIKKIMYDRLFEEKKEEPKRKESAEESQVWQKLLESGKKYDGDKMANALSKARENGAMLAKSERWGYVISIENCSEASKKDYEESIKPYLMHHKEWLARMLKNFAQ